MSKKNIIIVSVLGVLAIISSVIFLNIRKKTFDDTNDKKFKIEFANPNCTSADSTIKPNYSPNIISRCGEIYYSDDNHKDIPLGEAIENEYITNNDLTNKMTLIDKSDNDLSEVYIYNSPDKSLSNVNFRLEVCKDKDRLVFMNDKTSDYTCTPRKEKDFTITLENGKCNSKEKVIYEINENYKIYSRCGNIYYTDKNNNKIPLSEAIENYYITTWDIANKMEVYDAVFDGGTTIYQYNKKSESLSDSSFKLEICNKINGKRDQLFLSIHSNNYKCA